METQTASKTQWNIDLSHSEVAFKVKHLMIAHVKGSIKNFSVNVEGDNLYNAEYNVIINAASVFTNDENRDNHLKSPDFFDVENFPSISFSGKGLNKISSDLYELKGTLTIKNISKEISVQVEEGGIGIDPWGNEKAGFSFTAKINRKDFNLNWNVALEAGGVLVGEEVKISGEIQFAKQN